MVDDEDFGTLIEAGTVAERWDAARRLMARRKHLEAAASPRFDEALSWLGHAVTQGTEIDRLLAVDVLVRIGNAVKTRAGDVERALRSALGCPLPSLRVLDAAALPPAAKASEVRENVVGALKFAPDGWVFPWLISTLAQEERSARCRAEAFDRLVACEPRVEVWLDALAAEDWSHVREKGNAGKTAVQRARDILAAFSDAISRHRRQIAVGDATGIALQAVLRAIAPLSPNAQAPAGIDGAAIATASAVDGLIAARIDLVAEADTYAVLETVWRWWRPLPYPEAVAEAMRPVAMLIEGAIRLRAGLGQRSEGLAQRLTQALGSQNASRAALTTLADRSVGLSPDVDDWLRGIERTTSSGGDSTALDRVASRDILAALAPVFSDAVQAERLRWPTDRLKAVAVAVGRLGRSLALEEEGVAGEPVEFRPAVHETVDGVTPPDPKVVIVEPMIVRRRRDGGADVLRKAIVRQA
ncbi:hypothetical protein [Roseomonas genomospecies 6]|uniref:Uncharacterized protein n=1 Tax=Roseomonas genomospecies 6 TaxID=214106 RepID=A0A9W7NJG0_9PROT|nr:hypothetical protein [Roseomonas genomospecies 6]KAA0680357.1 hypothetical protein DS843_13670 [Roseomonas genomospecies 6]